MKGINLGLQKRPKREGKCTYVERLEQVEDAPGDDDVVIAPDDDGDDGGAEADSSQRRVDHVPYDEGALLELLPDPELEEEQRHALDDHHYQEGDDEGSCEKEKKTCMLPMS